MDRARLLLALGALGPVVFLAVTLAGAAATPGYDQWRDPVSALSQRGADLAGPINAGFLLAALLQMALGLGLIASFAQPALRQAGWLILAYAAGGALIAAAFPQDPIGGAVTLPGILHLVLVGVTALLLIAAMILARNLPGAAWFRPFTWTCLAAMGLGAGLSALAGLRGLPFLGLGERLTQDAYLLWLASLALTALTLRRPPATPLA